MIVSGCSYSVRLRNGPACGLHEQRFATGFIRGLAAHPSSAVAYPLLT
jgi:hypothetical protein